MTSPSGQFANPQDDPEPVRTPRDRVWGEWFRRRQVPRGTGPENYLSNDGKNPSFAALLLVVKIRIFSRHKQKSSEALWAQTQLMVDTAQAQQNYFVLRNRWDEAWVDLMVTITTDTFPELVDILLNDERDHADHLKKMRELQLCGYLSRRFFLMRVNTTHFFR